MAQFTRIVPAALISFSNLTSFDELLCAVSRAIAVTVVLDYCVWRLLIAWGPKDTYGQQASADAL